tara:strand:+ start:1491 stop:2294 length:804 start_codon:yes stop_codon:yes gene_type:complete
MEHVTFDDIPYHTIVECIAIHLGMKEFGALSMMSTYLRDIFMSNDVWKRLYVHTLRDKFKITDKSIHVGPYLSDHKNRNPVEELPWFYQYRTSYYLNDTWYHTVHPYERAMWRCGCVPVGSIHEIAEMAGDIASQCNSNHQLVADKDKNIFAKECLDAATLTTNIIAGHKHSHLCTNINHYLFDTLDAPKSVRNYKSFRKQVLRKYLTQAKKDSDVKKAATRISTKKIRISQYKGYISQLKMEIESDKAVVDKNKSLCSSLTLAVKK